MSEDRRRELCTIDHSGKQFEKRDRDEQRFWLELVRRRRAALEHQRPPREA